MTRLTTFFFLLVFSPVLFAQESATSSCPCTLRGTVIDSVTGAPVRHALVESSAGSPNPTLTDSEGSFHFDGVPAGSITISATKPGYAPKRLLTPPSATFQFGPGSLPTVIKLLPAGTLSGRVVDDRGEPLEGFRVDLIRRAPGEGTLFLFSNPSNQITTNDLGKFRIPDLPPASYFLLVSPPEMKTHYTPDSTTPFGFPPTYYPGVLESSSASLIKISAGHETQANLTLTAKPAVRLSGAVSGHPPGSLVQVSLQADFQTTEALDAKVDPRTGSFQTDWIPPGRYHLHAESPSPSSSDETLTAEQSITAVSSISGIHLVFTPDVNLRVRVLGFPPGAEDQRIMIYAHSEDSARGGSASPSRLEQGNDPASEELYTLSLAPGKYWLELTPYMNEPYYVESATFGSANLLGREFTVDSSSAQSSIDIRLRRGAATLSGTVTLKDASHGAYVCLFPPDSGSNSVFHVIAADGSFKFDHLAPGSYRIAAVDGQIDPNRQNLEQLKKISAAAKELSLSPEQSLSLTLDLSPVED